MTNSLDDVLWAVLLLGTLVVCTIGLVVTISGLL